MKTSLSIFDYYFRDDVVIIHDFHNAINKSKTVTNDIENVIDIIAADLRGLKDKKIIYRDTNNEFTEIIIRNDRFYEFRILNTKSFYEAIKKLKEDRHVKGESKNNRY